MTSRQPSPAPSQNLLRYLGTIGFFKPDRAAVRDHAQILDPTALEVLAAFGGLVTGRDQLSDRPRAATQTPPPVATSKSPTQPEQNLI
jgi:hypothetical protein